MLIIHSDSGDPSIMFGSVHSGGQRGDTCSKVSYIQGDSLYKCDNFTQFERNNQIRMPS